MGLRFRKSIKIAPGVKLNIGKNSVGFSIGNKYTGISANSKTGVTKRTSIPGTGISYTKKISNTKTPSKEAASPKANISPIALRILGSILLAVGIAGIVVGQIIGKVVGFDIILYIIGIFCSLLGILYIIASMKKK